MSQFVSSPTSLMQEMKAAAHGVFALVVGDRRAADSFDFSSRGLVGSFIAFLVATLINAYLPVLLGLSVSRGSITRGLISVAVLFALQVACSALLLRQLRRLDGFVPYLVADNWSTFFVTLLSTALTIFRLSSDILMVAVFALGLVLEINIARLLVKLRPLQIAMLLVAQMVGILLGLLVFGGLMAPDLMGGVNP